MLGSGAHPHIGDPAHSHPPNHASHPPTATTSWGPQPGSTTRSRRGTHHRHGPMPRKALQAATSHIADRQPDARCRRRRLTWERSTNNGGLRSPPPAPHPRPSPTPRATQSVSMSAGPPQSGGRRRGRDGVLCPTTANARGHRHRYPGPLASSAPGRPAGHTAGGVVRRPTVSCSRHFSSSEPLWCSSRGCAGRQSTWRGCGFAGEHRLGPVGLSVEDGDEGVYDVGVELG
jgi:hypothetical protein